MILLKEWNAMSRKEQTLWLEFNKPANNKPTSKSKFVGGVGVNDATYCIRIRIDGKLVMCPCYMAWTNMLERAYSDKLHAKYETYKDVTVCDEWKNFCAFRSWWIENQVDGFSLDKDLLSDAGVYSPDECIFVPQWLNTFTIDSGARRGKWPIGVGYHDGASRFRAQCRNPITRKGEYLGLFTTPEEAHLAWLKRKLELALELKPKMDEIDPRIYPRVIEIINSAKVRKQHEYRTLNQVRRSERPEAGF